MKQALLNTVDSISETVPQAENEYMGEDGLLHCSVCGKAVQTVVELFGQKKTVRCICDCRLKERKRYEERQKQEARKRRKRVCFVESEMEAWTFENDDKQNPKISNAALRYAKQFDKFKRQSKGLMFFGNVGTGKSFLAACIANKLIDDGYSCYMTNFATIINKLSGMYEGKQTFIEALNTYDLLIIDDLGTEAQSEYRQEIVFNVIDSRYRSGKPFIVTTNLTSKQLKAPDQIGLARIYDRVLERCMPIEVEGASRRRKKLKDDFNEMKGLLGL